MKNLKATVGRFVPNSICHLLLALGLGVCGGWEVKGDTIYDNSTNDLRIRFDPGAVEVGDQIVLQGTARYLTNFSFEYWGTSDGPGAFAFAGNVEACVRFYLNDGPEFNGYATPGRKFYESGWFGIQPSERSVLQFMAGADFDSGGLLIPVEEFTWSVQFRGMGAGDAVGVDLYGPLGAGSNYPDYWEHTTEGWKLMTNAATAISFAAVLEASHRLWNAGGIIYNNSTNDLRVRFDPGTLEIADDIVLGGTARYLTNFSFEYWGTSTTPGLFAGEVEACIRFYMNNGNYNAHWGPGSKLYDSGWFSIQPTERSVLVFSSSMDLPPQGLLLPLSSVAWSVQFRGMGPGDAAGVDLYGPLTTGLGYPDYWVREGGLWELRDEGTTAINFAAVMAASAGPVNWPPDLEISPLAGKAVVSWPRWASDYELLGSPQLVGETWGVVTSEIYTLANRYVLTNTVEPGKGAFFRLRKRQ